VAIWAQNPRKRRRPKPDAAAGARRPAGDTTAKIITTVNTVILAGDGERLKRRLGADLTREEFRIFDDNIEQRISLFSVKRFRCRQSC